MLTREQVDAKIREFYRGRPDLWLPEDFRHRYFKFVWKHPRRSAMHIRDTIRTEEDLLHYLIKYAPHHVYVSVSTWLDPTTVHGRRYHPPILHSDLVFDIDSERISAARDHTLRLLAKLREMGYSKFTIVFTGHKGFQVWVKDFPKDRPPEHPEDRLKFYEDAKRKIFEEIYSEGIDIDMALWDAFRVVRVPGTIHATTLLPARVITEEELRNGKWRQPRKVYPDKPDKPTKHTIAKSLTSNILGTKDRHVIFIDIDEDVDLSFLVDVLETAAKVFSLPDMFVFKTERGYKVLCPKAAPVKHVLKVKMFVGDDPGHIEFMRARGYDIFRVSDKIVIDDTGKATKSPPPVYLGTIHTGIRTQVSRGHLLFINRLGIPLSRELRESEWVGREEVRVIGAYSIR